MRQVRVGRWPSEGPSSASAVLDIRNAVVMRRYTLAAPRWVPVDPGRSRRPALHLVGHGSAPSTGRFSLLWPHMAAAIGYRPRRRSKSVVPWFVCRFSPAGGLGQTPAAVATSGEVLLAWTQGEPNALGDRSRVAGATRPADSAFGSSRRLSAPEVNVETPSLAAARGRRACRTAHGPV